MVFNLKSKKGYQNNGTNFNKKKFIENRVVRKRAKFNLSGKKYPQLPYWEPNCPTSDRTPTTHAPTLPKYGNECEKMNTRMQENGVDYDSNIRIGTGRTHTYSSHY